MLVSAAVLPHPPVLVPDVASGAAPELEPVRAACTAALEQVQSTEPDLVVLVGVGGQLATFGPGSVGSLAGVGVPMRTALPGAAPEPDATLPLPLTVGAWLMQGHQGWPTLRAQSVPAALTPGDATSLGQRWAATAERVAIVAMGDGSAALTRKAPGYLVDGAQLWQKRVTQALAEAELDVIENLDADDAAAFVAAGLPTWQVLAGAARATETSARGRWCGTLLADASPYGVAYVVASWMWEQA